MERKWPLYPESIKSLEKMGENIKLARKRRHMSGKELAERAFISLPTLWKIEKGDPSVSIGAYAQVLLGLSLTNDFEKVASDDELGRKLQDLDLLK